MGPRLRILPRGARKSAVRLEIPREYRFPAAVGAALLAVATLLVVESLRRPTVEAFIPTPPVPAEAGDSLIGPVIYTIDTSSTTEWRFFDFSQGSLVEAPGPRGWDLAFQRFHVISNGGEGFAGDGGILARWDADFDSAATAPPEGYEETRVRRDSVNLAIRRWYDYGFISHLLLPKRAVYFVRTADGRYAKIEILSYYCPGAVPGCLTFRYVYQGAGGRELGVPPGGPGPRSSSPEASRGRARAATTSGRDGSRLERRRSVHGLPAPASSGKRYSPPAPSPAPSMKSPPSSAEGP